MARKPPEQEKPRRPKEPRVTLTAAGLHALIYFVDRLGQPDEIGPGDLVFVWFDAGAILVLIPDHVRCALRDSHDDTFFELFGWCAYHRVEVDVLSPEEFDEDADQDEQVKGSIHWTLALSDGRRSCIPPHKAGLFALEEDAFHRSCGHSGAVEADCEARVPG